MHMSLVLGKQLLLIRKLPAQFVKFAVGSLAGLDILVANSSSLVELKLAP